MPLALAVILAVTLTLGCYGREPIVLPYDPSICHYIVTDQGTFAVPCENERRLET